MTFGARNIDRAPDVFTVKSMDWLEEKMSNTWTILCVIAIVAISFNLGMHWEAMTIKDKLQEDGEVIRKWGNNAKVKIVGVAEDL